MVKQIDMHLYKNQKEESRGISFNIYSNGNTRSSNLNDKGYKRSSLNTIQSLSTAHRTIHPG